MDYIGDYIGIIVPYALLGPRRVKYPSIGHVDPSKLKLKMLHTY